MLRTILIGLVLLVAGLAAVIRLAPADLAYWHADPQTLSSPGLRGWLVRPADGDAQAPVLAATPAALLAAFDAAARDRPRMRAVAGSLEAGLITYETRSRFWGFPDYISVTALPSGAGATLAVVGRSRFGGYDQGVNRATIEALLAAAAAPFAPLAQP
jgi:hypothetical protein